jgi:gamma-glutamylcyclotransferase (GGCT)/AIG2-like uncharacterized protein YtfP
MNSDMYGFVYGTLKQGKGNHIWMHVDNSEGPEFIGEALTTNPYYMTTCGFPYVIDSDDLTEERQLLPVKGELYRIDDKILASMDMLEGYRGPGCHNHYNREVITVVCDGQEYQTYIYVAAVEEGDTQEELPPVSIRNHEGKSVYFFP